MQDERELVRRKVASMIMHRDKDISNNGKAINRYLICSSQRSGSTLLSELLTNSGVAGSPTEYFNELYIAECYGGEIPGSFDINSYLKIIEKRRTSPNGTFGVKAHYPQLMQAIKNLDLTQQKNFINQFNKFIYIQRKDKISQAVSLYRALHTGRWTSQHSKLFEADEIPPPFNPDAIGSALNRIQNVENAWHKFFNYYGLNPIRISYEDFTKDPKQGLAALLKNLDVTLDSDVNLVTKLQKQSDGHNEFLVKQFKEFLERRFGNP